MNGRDNEETYIAVLGGLSHLCWGTKTDCLTDPAGGRVRRG